MKRILWVSEASFLNTGFSVLTKDILSRLYKTGKYEIAELGSYAKSSDPRAISLPWRFFGGVPEDGDAFGHKRYTSNVTGQFGEAVFEQVCLDFKPDIVVDVRDHWMVEFQLRSPFRKYYKLLWMPTIDGEPQKMEWIDSYRRADAIVTYSEYGKKVLAREAPNINVLGVINPGVDPEIFRPMDKKALRAEFGLNPEWKILTTVMRNQKRKLYPDLIEMFLEYLKLCSRKGNEFLLKNSYLYLHTSYPDVGYDLSRYILSTGLGHRILMTHVCGLCGKYYPDFFQTELSTCRFCGNQSAHLPNTSHGLKREEVARIINLAELYIQYSICEGFGMPIAEAKACGIPAIGVDYSATADQVRVEGCSPIRVERYFNEAVIETEQKRALPDNKDAAAKTYDFFSLTEGKYKEYSDSVRKDAMENHSFERSAKIFENVIDGIDIHDRSKTWDNPRPTIPPMNLKVPDIQSSSQMTDWCIDNILGEPEMKQSFMKLDIIRDLNTGFSSSKGGRSEFNKEAMVNFFASMAKSKMFWETQRVSSLTKDTEPSISWKLI